MKHALVLTLVFVAAAVAMPQANCRTAYMVPMRDGIKLSTIVTLPSPCDGRYPVVIDRTPYGPESDSAAQYIKYGFGGISQDQRGCVSSEGTYDFWREDGYDAYDTMEWITNQSWSNGDVYQVGVSADACSLYTDFIVDNPYIKGAYAIWGTGFGHETSYWGGAYVKGLVGRWLDSLTALCHGAHEVEQEVEQHEAYDDWWANLEADGPYGDHFPSDHVAGVHRAGWWDIFQQPMLDVYTGAVTEGDPAIRKEQYLFVEPLGHCESESTSFRYPNYTITDYFETSLAIFRNDYSDPVFDRIDYINIYVLGQVPAFVPKGTTILGNYWASLPAWPTQTLTNYYLNADTKALTTTAPTNSASLTYTYDPKDPVTTYGGNNLLVTPCGPQDQSKIEARSDVLSFTGPALTAPLALCGKVTAQIYVSSDQVDTDFYVSLTDVYPDGQSVLVRYGAIRMRWRDSANTTSLMQPGKTYGVNVNMWSTAYIYDTNHKIRVTVTSSNSPQFTVNPNNGHLLADPSQPVYVAKNTLYTAASTPSYVSLPIVKLSDLPQNNDIK